MADHILVSHAAAAELFRSLGPGRWTAPTGCTGWHVADVVRHVVTGDRAFTVSLGGTRYDLAAIAADVAEIDVLDLPDAFDVATTALVDALAAADPTSRYPTGIGDLTAEAIGELRSLEAVVHGWDVATALDVPFDVDHDLATLLIGAAERLVASLPPDRAPFGAPRTLPDTAPPLDRLVAMLGR